MSQAAVCCCFPLSLFTPAGESERISEDFIRLEIGLLDLFKDYLRVH